MKKYIITAVVILTILVLGNSVAKSAGLYYIPSAAYSVASTTSTYVIGGTATTTKTITSDGFQQVSWLVALASSSTPPTLCWKNEYSNNGIDWYTESNATSTYVHNNLEKTECWTYATTTASEFISLGSDGVTRFIGRRIIVPNLDTTYTRTLFSVNPGVNARLDVRSSLKNEVVIHK